MSKASNGYFGLGKAEQIKSAAKSTFGVVDTCGVYARLIVVYIEQINFMENQITGIEEEISAIMDEMDSKITTICGIGQKLGAAILSEVGNVTRFKSAEKLAAYAGVDPTVKQSGDFSSNRNHMSKRGFPLFAPSPVAGVRLRGQQRPDV